MTLPFCNQTVTVYRKENGTVTRRVIRNGFFYHSDYQEEDNLGRHRRSDFLLIVPRGAYIPRLEDRLVEGLGPRQVDWETFRPGVVRGLGEVAYVTTTYSGGKVHHYEAGAGSTR